MSLIPFANPHAAYLERRQAILEAITRVCDSGRYILGDEVANFESAFAAYVDAGQSIGVGNGTDAIELCLRGLGVGEGQAVFTVSHTAVATVAAVERAGAVPVLVDVDPLTGLMCPQSLVRTVEHVRAAHPELRPGAVIPVHLYGNPCDLDALCDVAQKYSMPLVEDCAQAHGAQHKGRRVGSIGRAGAFSFYPTKNLGTLGDAGGITTSDATLAEEMRALRQYGWKERYISASSGINSRLDPLHAAILSVQLGFLENDVKCRQSIAATYDKALASTGLILPHVAWGEHAYHLYVVRTHNRSAFMDFMQARGVGTAVHYPAPVHAQPAYAGFVLMDPHGLPQTELWAAEVVSLPMFPQLTQSEIERVCEAAGSWKE